MRINSTTPVIFTNYKLPDRAGMKQSNRCDEFTSYNSKPINFGTSVPKFIRRLQITTTMKEDAGFHCYLADK